MKISQYSLMTLLIFIILSACSDEPASEESAEQPDAPSSEESSEEDSEQPEGEEGGVLDVAYNAQPSTLDPHNQSAVATRDPARHIFEPLLTLNTDYEVSPVLAESYDISEDGSTVTFQLREGVYFHNGGEMTADDVVASMNKWLETPFASENIGENAEFEKIDDYEVVLNEAQDSPLLPTFLAEIRQFPAIMPEDVVESTDSAGNVEEYIGTGPYELAEWAQDQYIHLTKFADYTSPDGPSDGLAGEKNAYLDDIFLYFVPDSSTAVSGLMSGEYDFAYTTPYDNYEMLENDPNITNDLWTFGIKTLIFNNREGIFSDENARKAVNLALDKGEILHAAFAEEEFIEMDPAYFFSDQQWYTDAGAEHYNQQNLSEAENLLEEAGYDGEEVVILTSRDYEFRYNAGIATQQQLEAIGMNVTLDVYDQPTLLDIRNDPEAYDIFYTSFSATPTPHQFNFLDSEWAGWTDSPEIDRLLEEMNEQPDEESAIEVYEELQEEMWDYLPVINIGRDVRLNSFRENVEGYEEFGGLIFWNTTIE